MIKAIFFDIDGTLVSFDTHEIPQSTFDALYQLKEKGIKLFIATGRGKDGLHVL
ncbi:MAG: HAD-IIB family hydrolase, partial [Coprobacillus sp.]